MNFFELLKFAREKNASDIHLKPGNSPILRIYGKLYILKEIAPLSDSAIYNVIKTILRPDQLKILERDLAIDSGFSDSLGRYRVNIFHQKGKYAIAIRIIPSRIKTIRELNLPRVVEKISLEERGLVLVTGVAGTGKSTTLAAMINHINRMKTVNIITIEDPIEYEIEETNSIVSQREVGIDTRSFQLGLKEALRQDPNVIMVGEMRDLETISTALLAAETGHLVMSTLHTLDAKETINRIISIFPPYQQEMVRIQLASVLKAVISQRLVPTADGKGRVPAVEIMVVTERIKEMIKNPERLPEIYDAISEGYIPYGMQTFDQSLFYLYKRGLITKEIALEFSTNKESLRLRLEGILDSTDKTWALFEEVALRDKEQFNGG